MSRGGYLAAVARMGHAPASPAPSLRPPPRLFTDEPVLAEPAGLEQVRHGSRRPAGRGQLPVAPEARPGVQPRRRSCRRSTVRCASTRPGPRTSPAPRRR